jgi:hypothetical protein
MADDKCRLPRRHTVLMPLARRGDKQRQHAGMRIATGGGKRLVVMDT